MLIEITKINLRLVFLENLLWNQCLFPSTVTIIFRVASHRITEYDELKGTQEYHWVPALHRTIPKNHTTCSKILSKDLLNSDRLVQWPLPWGYCSSAQKPSGWRPFFLIRHLNLPWYKSRPFPWVNVTLKILHYVLVCSTWW